MFVSCFSQNVCYSKAMYEFYDMISEKKNVGKHKNVFYKHTIHYKYEL